MLDLTGVARGKLELHRRPTDVRPLLEHALQNYCAGAARTKNLRVSMEVTAAETHVLGDSSRLTQVFWNLLQNACKFTPAGGTIDIRVFNEPQIIAGTSEDGTDTSAEVTDLVVLVSDSGIGIGEEDMPRIFNAFEQGERSRTRIFGGLGLGLAISRAIVELHGGIITARSDGPGKGTQITIRLATVPERAEAAPSPDQGHAAAAQDRALRILLVEDHPDTAQQLSRLLQRSGHTVTCAGSLAEAQAAMDAAGKERAACPFDLLISDLGLPDGNGQELMRDLGACLGLPGIALSGFGMKEDIAASLAAGFARHLTKPVDWQELKTVIRELAARLPA